MQTGVPEVWLLRRVHHRTPSPLSAKMDGSVPLPSPLQVFDIDLGLCFFILMHRAELEMQRPGLEALS